MKNFALEVVHKDIDDIDAAFSLLTKQFCNSNQVFLSKYNILVAECERRWPALEASPKEVYQKVTRLISQFEDLGKLIDNGSVKEAELYNTGNVLKLYGIMPDFILDKALEEECDDEDNVGKVRALKNGLEGAGT